MFKRTRKFVRRHRYKLLGLVLVAVVGYYFCLPKVLFDDPTSTVLFDTNGELLGAKIASDGQWRFPERDTVPYKFEQAIITFEDKRFYNHWGVDIWAIGRALKSNWDAGRRVSGGSTLTMQTIRLMRKNPSRTIWEKIKEVILATRIEWSYSKGEILALYASHAPFGGNVVGLDAAAWKYFGRSAEELSWGEAAMLAVLPNSPSLIHLGRNREKLKNKRDRLLDLLLAEGIIDEMTCSLAKLEELPDKPKPLPQVAPHLMERLHQEYVKSGKLGKKTILTTTLQRELQEEIDVILAHNYEKLSGNEIHNAAVMVVEVETGDILAYTGNINGIEARHSPAVDVIPAPRSSGSILKPFLYASMLHDGELLPHTLYPDIPSQYGSYAPKNFDSQYRGAIPASEMVSRSLNVPAVHMLYQYTTMKFLHKLQQMGSSTLKYSPNHYGLTLVLGGAETSVWDLGRMYGGMARNLKHFAYYNGKYDPNAFKPLNFMKEKSSGRLVKEDFNQLEEVSVVNAGAVWHTFNAMQEVARPGDEHYWQNFASSRRVAWKTGTSFGFRDAWAVGCTPDYVVVVWVGNADGEGRPGLVGVKAAAPILFDVLNVLNVGREWFEMPYDDMIDLPICQHSGHQAGEHCTHIDTLAVPRGGDKAPLCPYHKKVHLDQTGTYQVHSGCASPQDMQHTSYFILPPRQEWYYKSLHPDYEPLPPYREDCKGFGVEEKKNMALIYPRSGMKIYVPTELDETKSRTVFEAAHSDARTIIHWHLDDVYLGKTQDFHKMSLNPVVGQHTITLVDEHGEQLSRSFEILAEER